MINRLRISQTGTTFFQDLKLLKNWRKSRISWIDRRAVKVYDKKFP
jgi:hypothetical protein